MALRRRVLFASAMVLLVIGFLELTLGLAALLSTRVHQLLAPPGTAPIPPTVPDARLGHRPNPSYPGHDRKGFRNPAVPVTARIVALGDSQTYGTNVGPGDAWPRQLESLTGTTVYSMACGGYGPAHSLILWDEALTLSPAIVIEAFYAGNDLFDSFDLVYNRGQLPELRNPDPEVQASVREAERAEPIAERASRMFEMRTAPAPVRRREAAGPRHPFSLRGWIETHSKLCGLFRAVWRESARAATDPGAAPRQTPEQQWGQARMFAERHRAYCQAFTDERFKTVFTSEYRLTALDLGDPRILEGLRISLDAMQSMHRRAVGRNIRFLVVLIPTKEMVFRDLWQSPSASYRSLTENEERLWKLMKAFLEDHGIEYVDALPVLRDQLAASVQPYPVSHDGHPNESGHKAIARLVASRLAGAPGSQAQVGKEAAADPDGCR